MAGITSKEAKAIIKDIERFSQGEIFTPISFNNKESLQATILKNELESFRQQCVITRSKNIENYEKIQREIADVAHDLKTPLALISGYVECVQDGIDDKDYLTLISEKVTLMNETVYRIIEGSRTVYGETKKEKKICSSREYFKTATSLFNKEATAKNLRFILKRVPECSISIAEKDINSVLNNLFNNALKHTSNGNITISFKKNKKYLTTIIKDTGAGINEDDIEHVFERFYSGDKSRIVGGSGIGLSSVKAIIEDHGGTITCKSKLNKGSTFSFTLPIYDPNNNQTYNAAVKEFLKHFFRTFLFPFLWIYDFFMFIKSAIDLSKIKK